MPFAQKRGSMRSNLVRATYNSFLIAYTGGKYYEAAHLLHAVSKLVGVRIAQPWFGRNLHYGDNVKHQTYCSNWISMVMIGVDKYLKRVGDRGSLQVLDGKDEADNSTEDDQQ